MPLTGLQGASDAEAKASTMAIAQQVMQRINTQAVVTGPALTAVSLILRGYEATVADLAADSALLAAYVAGLVTATGWPVILAPEASPATDAHRGVVRLEGRPVGRLDRDERACRQDLALLGLPVGPTVAVGPEPVQRASLDWHLGAIGHLLAPLGVVARHVADGGALSAGDVTVLAARYDTLRADPTMRLYWPEATASATILAEVLAFITARGWATGTADGGMVLNETAGLAEVWRRLALLAPVAQPGAAESAPAAVNSQQR
jgi:hypothetical protein